MTSLFFRGLFLCASLAGSVAYAAEHTFTIDESLSVMTATGHAAGYPIQQQGPGSLVSRLSGTLVVDITDEAITFKEGSVIDALVNGDWQPLPGGQPGSAPADFAGQALVIISSVKAAFRNIVFTAGSGEIPVDQEGAFGAEALLFSFPADSTASFDFDGSFFGRGTKSLAGLQSNSTEGTGTITESEGVQTLTIPFKGTFVFETINEDDSELELEGQLVATRSTSVPVEFDAITVDNNTLTITFRSSPGAESELQYTHNFKTWLPVTSGVTTVSPGVYRYTAAPEGAFTFFKIVQK